MIINLKFTTSYDPILSENHEEEHKKLYLSYLKTTINKTKYLRNNQQEYLKTPQVLKITLNVNIYQPITVMEARFFLSNHLT